MAKYEWVKSDSDFILYRNGKETTISLFPDERLWRIRHNGKESDIVNLNRAKWEAYSLAIQKLGN